MDENYYNIRKHLRWLSNKVDEWSDQDASYSLDQAEILYLKADFGTNYLSDLMYFCIYYIILYYIFYHI
jgi:hypothetical protein